MEIQWKHVFIFFGVLILLINLLPIVNTIAGIFSDSLEAINVALEPLRSQNHGSSSSTYALAKLCVFLIFVVGVLKVIKNWSK